MLVIMVRIVIMVRMVRMIVVLATRPAALYDSDLGEDGRYDTC